MSETSITTLNGLLQLLGLPGVVPDRPILGLAIDSRRVQPGELFLAVPGCAGDGRDYIAQAVHQGATAVLAQAGRDSELAGHGVPVIAVANLNERLGPLACHFYRTGQSPVKVIGVTGTNGKTSCCWFLAQLLAALDQPCALMGTLGKGMPEQLEPTCNTTLDVISTHGFIAGLREQQVPALAMEVSSHGLDQGRVAGVHFDVGVFTNISRDHLDTYDSLDDYAAAKAALFSRCTVGCAVINWDDPYGALMQAACPPETRVLTWSQSDPRADVYATDIALSTSGLSARVHTPWGSAELTAPLMGRFNLENLLTVIAVLAAQGFTPEQVTPLIAQLRTVPGRMQRLGGGARPLVLVDYAHTPDALKSALAAVREHGSRRLVCVFGCGGDRDRGKRPLMAEAALAGADQVIVTSDNPRTEVAEDIISDILAGMDGQNRSRVHIEVDRTQAIRRAIASAGAEDIILVAGKGHENYQEIQGVRYPFDDCDHVQHALNCWSPL